MKITIVSSSTRIGRNSHRVALHLESEIKQRGHKVEIVDLLELNLPMFEERFSYLENPSEELKATNALLNSSDAFIFLTPEYNGSFSSGLKNFIDVFAKAPFEGKAIGVVTASTGAMGGIRAAYQLQQLVLSIFAYPIPQMLTVANVDKQLDENGVLLLSDFKKRVDSFLNAFLSFTYKITNNK